MAKLALPKSLLCAKLEASCSAHCTEASELDIFVTLTYDMLAIKTKTMKETSRQNPLITESCHS